MAEITNTQFIKGDVQQSIDVAGILDAVCKSMVEKGYNPINQIVGYIMSGDPTYITSYRNARSLIMKVERDELVEEMMKNYIDVKGL